MTAEPLRLPRAAPVELTACDREPIHIPGHIQPHGVLIATAPDQRRISHVSENARELTGLLAESMLGMDLERLVGAPAFSAIEQMLEQTSYSPSNVLKLELPIPFRPRRKVLVHRWQDRTVIELEDAAPYDESGAALSRAQNIIASLSRVQTVDQLCDEAAREIRQLTGYDRVMIYRFEDAAHGRVVAEDKAPELPPNLNLRYPASDIPVQARRLYEMQRVRGIPDTQYRPARVLAADGDDLDMSLCALRGISPIHLEYMGNMGVRASFSASLLRDEKLIGMILCHHRSPLALSADLRALCDVIGQLISALLIRVAETEILAARLRRNRATLNLLRDIEDTDGVAAGLCRQSATVLDLMGAGGLMIRCNGDTRLVGTAPPMHAATAIIDALLRVNPCSITFMSDAGAPNAAAASFANEASGILVMPLRPGTEDVIAWFRPEVPRTIQWAGNPNKPVVQPNDVGFSPRKSFAAWSEMQRGRSEPWSAIDLEVAADLRELLTRALLRHAEAQLAHLSAYDSLTGLANRRTIQAHLKAWQQRRSPEIGALLFIDLDRFKTVNDTLGHAAGDECLIQMAGRLRHLSPPASLLGRLGGDEFVLFWPGAGQSAAQALAQALVVKCAQPYPLMGRDYYSGASIGVACAGVADFDDIMRQADAAMYAAKRQGGGQAVVFQPDLHASVLVNMHTEQDLFAAIGQGELEVHYQPQVRVTDRRICGFEALVRWRHPVNGWVSPNDFIPRAEDAGLIAHIGMWVLSESVRRIVAWRLIQPGLTMSVNISPRQLTSSSLSTWLSGEMAAEGVPPEAICLELTESTLLEPDSVRELESLRQLGVKIAVDDFGTGQSSLAYLQGLPVDIVKIDRSFVAPLGTPKADRFFTAIVNLARTIDLKTVAEGCESDGQWQVIQSAGCEVVQGWLVAPAMDAAAAELFLATSPYGSTPAMALGVAGDTGV